VRIRGKGDNKLYAFVNFRAKELALKAIQKLNNKDLKVCFHLNSESIFMLVRQRLIAIVYIDLLQKYGYM
jgi:hypothetical protein